MLNQKRAGFASFHVERRRILGAKDGADGKDEIGFPDCREDNGNSRMIKDAVESGGDIVGHLKDLLGRIRNAEIPQPGQVAHESGAIIDWWVFKVATFRAGVWDLTVGIPIIVR